MKQAILDSSCLRSKKLFPSNTNTNFTVQLPQRMEFQRDSTICLKSIHMANEFKRGCTIRAIVTTGDGSSVQKIEDLDESISTIEDLVKAINDKIGGIVHFAIEEGGLTTIKFGDKCEENFTIRLEMSRNLMHILGFQQQSVIFTDKKRMLTSTHMPNIDAVHQCIFVCCNIVEPSVTCGQMHQVLQFFCTPNKVGKTIYHEFQNNLPVKLDRKQFDRIKIQIRDTDGKILECKEENVPTHVQLVFENKL